MPEDEIEPSDATMEAVPLPEPEAPPDDETASDEAQILGEGESEASDVKDDIGEEELDPHPGPQDAKAPHPLYSHPYIKAFNVGKADPIQSTRLTCESVLGHFRDLAGAYDTLSGSGVRRHKNMQDIFAKTFEKVSRELKWLDRTITSAMNSPKHMLPVLARLGELRGTRTKAMPWHVLALQELGILANEAAALLRMNMKTYSAWARKAKIEAQKRGDSRTTAVRPDDWPLTPLHPDKPLPETKGRGGGAEDPIAIQADHVAILSDPVKRLQWSTRELFNAANTIQDEKIRFQYLSELADGAQKEAARETERIAEAAIVLLQFVPRLIEHLEQAVETWRAEVATELRVTDVPGLSVRDEAKLAIMGYGSFGKEVEAALEKL